MAASAPRVDQNRLKALPGATAGASDVKNSMRGALMLRTGVAVVARSGVRVAPNSAVGEGPPVDVAGGRVRVNVGVLKPSEGGGWVAVKVKVGVSVGRSVGKTCWAAGAHPANSVVMSISQR